MWKARKSRPLWQDFFCVICHSFTRFSSQQRDRVTTQKKPVEKIQQGKPAVTHGKYREKLLSSQQCAQDRVVVENNALSDIAQAQSEGKTLEQKAGEYVEAENERYKKTTVAE